MPNLDSLVVTKNSAQRPGDVIGSQLGGGDLIEHRLELVVVVAVEHDHVDVMLGEQLGAGDSGEPTAHNENRRVTHGDRLSWNAVGTSAGR
jgi:hypothetical protein